MVHRLSVTQRGDRPVFDHRPFEPVADGNQASFGLLIDSDGSRRL